MAGLLVLLAHPDDEFFCGGLLGALGDLGVPVHLAYWTRGEGGGSPRARLAARVLPEPLRPRVRAAKRAARLLRAASLTFLDAVDPAPDPDLKAPAQSREVFLKKLQALADKQKPEVVMTHGSQGDYGHPAHQRLHELTREWAAELGPMMSFNAAPTSGPASELFVNTADAADIVFDAEPYLELKRKLVLAHGAQGAALTAAAGGDLEKLLQMTRYEGYCIWSAPEAAWAALERWGCARQ